MTSTNIASPPKLTRMGVVVPVRDEEEHLRSSLLALRGAALDVADWAIPVQVVVVLDRCSDRSAEVAYEFRQEPSLASSVLSLSIVVSDHGNVGQARFLGVASIVASTDPSELPGLWLATTDADSTVPRAWLRHQARVRRRGVQAWAGTVVVMDWSGRAPHTRGAFLDQYGAGDSRHVHGANLAFTAEAYLRAGGFPPLPTAEDHGLWQALQGTGARTLYDRTCPVLTSARAVGRAPAGFASALDDLEASG